MKKPDLTVCMIIKNEERFLKDCLESIRDVAGQIVVVDTGSTDGSMDIARAFNAEIHHFEWCDDFSAARNASIRYARGEWILWLDADERLKPESVQLLRDSLRREKQAVIYQVQINNHTLDDAGAYISTAYRLFNNNKGIRFTGRIHEQVVFSGGRGERRKSAITLEHLGYALDAETDTAKKARNQKLLERMADENPDNAYAHFTLGQHYNLVGRHTDALRHLLKALNLDQFEKEMKASLYNVLSETYSKCGLPEEARRMAMESVDLEENQVGGYFMLFQLARGGKEWDAALNWLRKVREKNRLIRSAGWHIATDVVFEEEKLNYTEAEVLARAGRNDEAFLLLAEMINGGNTSPELWRKTLDAALAAERWQDAEKLAGSLFQKDTTNFYMLDTLGKIYIKQQRFPEATQVFEALCAQAPHNRDYRDMLGRLQAFTRAVH